MWRSKTFKTVGGSNYTTVYKRSAAWLPLTLTGPKQDSVDSYIGPAGK